MQARMYDLVVYLPQDWDSFLFGRGLLLALSQQFESGKILCVDRPICFLTGSLYQRQKFRRWITGRDNLRTLGHNLFLYRPFVLLHDHVAPKLPCFPAANRFLLRTQLHRVLSSLQFWQECRVAWIYDPFQREYLGLVNEVLHIYYKYDEYLAWEETSLWRTHAQLAKHEADVLNRLDIVLAVSESLAETLRGRHSNVHVVPNAIDSDIFFAKEAQTDVVPPELMRIPKPLLGFLGNLTPRIDVRLLYSLVSHHPEWSLVVIGKMGASFEGNPFFAKLRALPNTYILGPKPYETLPDFTRHFDVCLIPYVMDEFNVKCSPWKFYAYLPSGNPIVSVDIPQVRRFGDLVRIANDPVTFEQAVMAALNERDEDLRQRRLTAARENSWENRAAAVIEIINSSLEERQV